MTLCYEITANISILIMCRENDLQDQSYGETRVVILQEYDCEGVSVLLEDDCV